MLHRLSLLPLPAKLLKKHLLLQIGTKQFSQNQNYKIVQDPKDISKLVFDQQGKCLIFEHKNGEYELKWITRVNAFFTILNTVLTGMQFAFPVFGSWNQFSFGVCTGLGYLLFILLHTFSRRTIHRLHLQNNLQYVDVTFFSAFWVPRTVTFHISEFQDPVPSMAGFHRFDLTSMGKIWIKLQKNQFRNIKDYEQTLSNILLGKPITNLNVAKRKNKSKNENI